MAKRSLAAAPETRQAQYRVMIHLDTDGNGWLGKKGVLPEHVLRHYTCEGVLRAVWETEGNPVSVGRAMRIVPERTRRLVEDRDKACRYPGCQVSSFLENHHIRHWRDGGTSDHDSVVSLCPAHHREHHRGLFEIAGDPTAPNGLRFTNPHGLPIGPSPKRSLSPPPRPPTIRTMERGGVLHPQWVDLDPPIERPVVALMERPEATQRYEPAGSWA